VPKESTNLERVEIIALDISIWSGETRLRPEDIRLGKGGKLPPEKVASLGSKKIIDPEDLKAFRMLKKQAERKCEAVGIRFLGGFAVPREKTEAVALELAAIAHRFHTAVNDLLAIYEARVEEWIDQNRDFEEALRRSVIAAADVRNRFGFEYSIYRMTAAPQTGYLDHQVNRMGGRLFQEIAIAANELLSGGLSLDRAATEEAGVSHKVLVPLMRIREKLSGLSFLDSAVQPMVKAIDDVVAQIPKKGKIRGQAYFNVLATVLILSDPDKVKRLAAGLLSVRDVAAGPVAHGSATVGEDGEAGSDGNVPAEPATSLYF